GIYANGSHFRCHSNATDNSRCECATFVRNETASFDPDQGCRGVGSRPEGSGEVERGSPFSAQLRFGSKADLTIALPHVCFVLEAEVHTAPIFKLPYRKVYRCRR